MQQRGWLGWANDSVSSLATRLGLMELDEGHAAPPQPHRSPGQAVPNRSRRACGSEGKLEASLAATFASGKTESSPGKKAHLGEKEGPSSEPMELPGNIVAILECPVCMTLYKDKVMMCSNGHTICGNCLESLPERRCPTCRVKMGNIRCRIVERMLETAALPCVFKEYGCNYSGKGSDRSQHEKKCMFRPIPCLLRRCYPSCKWEGAPSSLVEHLNTHCSVRNVEPDTMDDVYWSYKTDKECFQRGKDAAYFLPWCQRFYYVSISKRGELFHLAALWFAISPKAAEEENRRIKMELVFPLDNQQSVSYSLYPRRLLPGEVLDEQISSLIQNKQSFIVPIRRWRREWSENKHKCYFQVRARWTDPEVSNIPGKKSSDAPNERELAARPDYPNRRNVKSTVAGSLSDSLNHLSLRSSSLTRTAPASGTTAASGNASAPSPISPHPAMGDEKAMKGSFGLDQDVDIKDSCPMSGIHIPSLSLRQAVPKKIDDSPGNQSQKESKQ